MRYFQSFWLAFFLIAIFLVSAHGQNLTPLLDCVEYDASTDTLKVHLGYDNRSSSNVTIGISSDNRFIPGFANLGQNTVFLPGFHRRAFSVTVPGRIVTQWLLNGRAVAFTNSQQLYCRQQSNQTPTITPFLTSVQLDASTGQATATFGYFSMFEIIVGIGSNNYFSFAGDATTLPYPGDRGQPFQFQAGLVRNAFQVTFNAATEPAIIWNLLGHSVVAVAPTAPTAASVGISGKVLNRSGHALSNAHLTIINTGTQEARQSRSNNFGYYRFDNVLAGETYLLEVKHKKHSFSPQILQVFEDVENLDLAAEN